MLALVQRDGSEFLRARTVKASDHFVGGHLPVRLPRLCDVNGCAGPFLRTRFGERLYEFIPF